ncbi:hypothetical protein DYB25_009540 [Aphanomyces astaci]|uniref:AMP-dependent synthetase/ligase domain-containing protein n=1 Tax=Aphanomyces astaci TaxID=112090 RepID=A0A396ZT52_APHAT|nr:hypothetical protein DYB25_009540 [Aphanomyces astaci]
MLRSFVTFSGPQHPALLDCTIGDMLDSVAAKHPDQLALVAVEEGVRMTYAQVHDKVNRYAQALHWLGLRRGDRFGIWLPNKADYYLLQWATAKLGVIMVNVNPAYRAHEFEFAMNLVQCKAVLVTPQVQSTHYFDMLHTLVPTLKASYHHPNHDILAPLNLPELPHLRHIIHDRHGHTEPGMVGLDALVASTPADHSFLDCSTSVTPDQVVNIQFTSGTTGSPKGAALTHHNLVNNGYLVGHRCGYSPVDRVCVPVPLYHCFGVVLGNLACLAHAATVVYPSKSFHATKALRAVEAEQCTALYGVPTMFIRMLNDSTFDVRKMASLRTGIMAGAQCPVDVMAKVMAFAPEMTIAYGMTETSPISFQTARDDALVDRVETIGTLMPFTQAKVVDMENPDVEVDVGKPGELLTKGYCVMKDQTRKAIVDGWMHTGDIVVMDDRGFCRVVGRSKDVIIRGGENIYPAEIEEVLFAHDAVANVSVVGVPDWEYGEVICAWVSLRDDAAVDKMDDVLREHVRANLAHFKIPAYFVFRHDFPTTITGKIQKFKTVDFFNEISIVYGTVLEFCNKESCPIMCAGPKFEYLWKDSKEYKTPAKLPAPDYIDMLMSWVEEQLNDQTLFPCNEETPYPRGFIAAVKNIFRRLFRVYAHVYYSHFDKIVNLGAEAHLNSCFKHFIYFVTEFDLVDVREQEPLKDLIANLAG